MRQKVKDQLVSATHQHKLRKDDLQRHYDSAKMTDDKRAELEKRSDLAGEEVEKCQQRLTEVTTRLLNEHQRVSRERKSELKDVLFVWTKMHLVHCQQSQQDWQMFHENMTGQVFTPDEDNFEIPRPTPASAGVSAAAASGGAAAAAASGPAAMPAAASFEDEVSV